MELYKTISKEQELYQYTSKARMTNLITIDRLVCCLLYLKSLRNVYIHNWSNLIELIYCLKISLAFVNIDLQNLQRMVHWSNT